MKQEDIAKKWQALEKEKQNNNKPLNMIHPM